MSKAYRQASPLNRAEVRRRLLTCAADTRAHKFTRVSEQTLNDIEAMVEARVRHIVHHAPSKGVTL